jgi:hypothetical protein
MAEDQFSEAEAHRHFAKSIHGEVWSLLGLDLRSEEQERLLLDAAHASLYHWRHAGHEVNKQRGEWLISRVHVVLGHAAEAVRHAQYCYDLTREHKGEMEDFDLAFAEEAMARALAALGELKQANIHWAQAKELGDDIENEEDGASFFTDLESGEWHGLV